MNSLGKDKRLKTDLKVVFNLIWSNFISKQVLIVKTIHDALGDTGKENGFYLPEVSHSVAEFDRAGFTNEEEVAVGLKDVVPFLLESKLIERGAIHTKAANFQAHIEVSNRLVTGQNPASAQGVGVEMVKLIMPST